MNRYDRRLDRLITLDGVYGVRGNGFHSFMINEIEFGARVALALDDDEQWWWELQMGGCLDFVSFQGFGA